MFIVSKKMWKFYLILLLVFLIWIFIYENNSLSTLVGGGITQTINDETHALINNIDEMLATLKA